MRKYLFIILSVLLKCSNVVYSIEIKITSVGDVIPHSDLQEYCIKKKSFGVLFNRLGKSIKNSDLAVANFEASINEKRKISGYPRFNAHPKLMTALKKAGFDVLSFANNHTLDTGSKGIAGLIRNAKKNKLIYSGVSNNSKSMFKPVFFTIKGVKFSYLSLTTLTNGLKNPVLSNKPKVFILNMKNLNLILKIIKNMKKKSNISIVSIHFGKEYIDYPTRLQKYYSIKIANAGADIILGNHSHHIQRPVWYNCKDGRKSIISYSQGNFISHQNRYITYKNRSSNIAKRGDSFLFHIYIVKDKKGVRIKKITYTPVWTLSFKVKNKYGFKSVLLKQEILNPLYPKQRKLLVYRRKRIIRFMKGFILEERF